MDEFPHPSKDERIEELERQVQGLSERLRRLEPQPVSQQRRNRIGAFIARRRAQLWAFRGEQWTGRVGLALLFLGLVFLFRYSVEQGWITPMVRVVFGLLLGVALLFWGLRASRDRPTYGALLLGGALAAFYATGWAASYLYQLVERPLAFAWMAGVTALGFLLARRHDQPALASLGALGGFATPFLLRPGSATALELVAYTILVVIWAAALYYTRGWRSVLWTYLGGGLSVLAIAAGDATGPERWLVQAGLLVTWAAGAVFPFLYEWSRSGARNPYRRTILPFALELRVLGAGGTAGMLAITDYVWSLPDRTSGVLFLAAAFMYAAFAWLGTREESFVARAAGPVAAALLATSTFLIFPDGPARWYAVAAEIGLFLYGGRTARFQGLEWVAHGLFGLLAMAIVRSAFTRLSPVAFDPLALSHLCGIIVAGGASGFIRLPTVRLAYRVAAHALALIWLAAEFDAISTASEWVTVAWGVYGALLLLAALEMGRRRSTPILGGQAFAASALALTVLKLLLLDMDRVSPLVRIPLFLGTGLALLGLSALFQRPVRIHRVRTETEPAIQTAERPFTG